MNGQDNRQKDRLLLTQEEEASLPLLKPLFAGHHDLLLGTFACDGSAGREGASSLSDDHEVARFKRIQHAYLFSLPGSEGGRSPVSDGVAAPASRDAFRLGAGWHLRICSHFLNSARPLVFETFDGWPPLHQTVWMALLDVMFRDREEAMLTSRTARDGQAEVAWQDARETIKVLAVALSKPMADERQCQAEHERVMTLLLVWFPARV
ncbi:MAG: hypothetical protein Q8L77_15925 [Nitrospirota bacterium]|nr:hypothetical protein [Nitrospirota bacterium]